jgi:hypothetical protein
MAVITSNDSFVTSTSSPWNTRLFDKRSPIGAPSRSIPPKRRAWRSPAPRSARGPGSRLTGCTRPKGCCWGSQFVPTRFRDRANEVLT